MLLFLLTQGWLAVPGSVLTTGLSVFGENRRSQTTSGQGWWKRSGSSHQIVLTAVTSAWEPRGAKEERGPEGGGLQPAKKPLSWRRVGNAPCFVREGKAPSISLQLQPLSRATPQC